MGARLAKTLNGRERKHKEEVQEVEYEELEEVTAITEVQGVAQYETWCWRKTLRISRRV